MSTNRDQLYELRAAVEPTKVEERLVDNNQHLRRSMYCDDCPWVGTSGELIARDKLRCPKCNSANVKYLVADAPQRIQ